MSAFVPRDNAAGLFEFYIDVGSPEADALAAIEYMLQPGNWLDRNTLLLRMQMPFVNGELAMIGYLEVHRFTVIDFSQKYVIHRNSNRDSILDKSNKSLF